MIGSPLFARIIPSATGQRTAMAVVATLFLAPAAGAGATADGISAAAPLVQWSITDVNSVGGFAPRVLGRPETLADGQHRALSFDGRGDGLLLPLNPLEGRSRFTVLVLLRPAVDGAVEQRFLHAQDKAGKRMLMELRLDPVARKWWLDTYLHVSTEQHLTLIDPTKVHDAARWTWVALVYDGRQMSHYVDGVREAQGEVSFTPMTAGECSLGVRLNRVNWFKGELADVRIYDRALSAEELRAWAQEQSSVSP